ncbi:MULTISPECIES: peptide-methionine (S)-S-oxide reductase MsrA [unclassified Actinobaculum]|uniref:peptide-methionine (S)-S-oxide reductase MsrA n=1 Tax=unclassified Actinobaculum TaxID=2609299 RepID=UPI000D529544|nr:MULTISPECIES: peptide-methionine (S)-S-oxide reductase MsrA [unclassified Actinobaculum]AWE41847.1 peptide-methionine (S)-S-oxide reductase MsrA [Actinobaculum sp. 313]RTE50235.1 peptide-methionine (S)-S-oxide reductase MsrA [Actinobaculum sp. 352]
MQMFIWDIANKTKMVTPEEALPGRSEPVLPNPAAHTVLGTAILADPQVDQEVIYLASGCFWGAEKAAWQLGADTTAVGYMGGFTPNPTYEEVCTGKTGHAETVRVLYSPSKLSTASLLQMFFESHDPTSLNRQGGDIGTQYRSAIFPTTAEQERIAHEMVARYQVVLAERGFGLIVTEIVPSSQAGGFYPAEDYHQQYLDKNPGGYECHSRTGIACPLPGSGPAAS